MTQRANAIDRHVAKRLRRARLECGKTARQAAAACGITNTSHIFNYESAYTRVPPSRLLPMARCYRKPIQWFFRGAPK